MPYKTPPKGKTVSRPVVIPSKKKPPASKQKPPASNQRPRTPATKPKPRAQAAGTPTAAHNKPNGSRYGTGLANTVLGPGGLANGMGRVVGTAGSYIFGRTEPGMTWNGSKWVKPRKKK